MLQEFWWSLGCHNVRYTKIHGNYKHGIAKNIDRFHFCESNLLREHSFDGFAMSARIVASGTLSCCIKTCFCCMSEARDDFVGVKKLESKEGLRLVGARWAKGSILQGGSYET